MRDDIVFTTICVSGNDLNIERYQWKGENHYFQVANILVHSVLKFSNAKIVVVTDTPEQFEKHPRVFVYDIRTLTSEPLIKEGYFNYHLKRFALQKAFERPEKYVVYLDCDVFLSSKMPENVFYEMDQMEADVLGRLGNASIRDMLGLNIQEASIKVKEFGSAWKDEYYDATLPHETFFIFKKNEQKQKMFLDTWDGITQQSLKTHRRIYADSYYIGCSILNSNMNKIEITTGVSAGGLQFLHNLNIIHDDAVNSIYIIKLEPFDYEKLLHRMK